MYSVTLRFVIEDDFSRSSRFGIDLPKGITVVTTFVGPFYLLEFRFNPDVPKRRETVSCPIEGE